jgi:L-lactate utilization protein LutB
MAKAVDKSQSNREDIIEIHGELKLIKHDIQNIKENHLAHLDYKITQMQKVLWVVFTGVFGNVLWVIKTALMD